MHDLTEKAFARLLTALDINHDRAAEKYELLRRKLIKMFERRQCANSEELADETLDRLTGKMETELCSSVSSVVRLGVRQNRPNYRARTGCRTGISFVVPSSAALWCSCRILTAPASSRRKTVVARQ